MVRAVSRLGGDMIEWISRFWWAVVLRGVLAVLFGVVAIVWPDITLLALVILFGAYALVNGIFAVISAAVGGRATAGRGLLVVEGALSILLGLAAIVWPGVTTLVLLWLIAVWALLVGVLEIVAAIVWRREITFEWLLAIAGVLSAIFGIALMAWPERSAVALVFLIGAFAVGYGVLLVASGLRLRQIHRALTAGPRSGDGIAGTPGAAGAPGTPGAPDSPR